MLILCVLKKSLMCQGQGDRRFPEGFLNADSVFCEGVSALSRTGLTDLQKSASIFIRCYVNESLLCQGQANRTSPEELFVLILCFVEESLLCQEQGYRRISEELFDVDFVFCERVSDVSITKTSQISRILFQC